MVSSIEKTRPARKQASRAGMVVRMDAGSASLALRNRTVYRLFNTVLGNCAVDFHLDYPIVGVAELSEDVVGVLSE